MNHAPDAIVRTASRIVAQLTASLTDLQEDWLRGEIVSALCHFAASPDPAEEIVREASQAVLEDEIAAHTLRLWQDAKEEIARLRELLLKSATTISLLNPNAAILALIDAALTGSSPARGEGK